MPANSRPAPECIRLRGVRQNNLKGFDLDLPLGKFIVVTGLSGAGKSSLVFDTLHAEGQRRYVETFSAYTRQFLDLLDKPKVDSVENIRPSIAIEQTNTVKTSRSTVGTMTELTDFAKVWFSHVAECFDPETGERVEDDTPQTIWTKTLASHPAATLLLCFRITKPDNLGWPEILISIKGQGYTRVLLSEGRARPPGEPTFPTLHKLDDLLIQPSSFDIRHSTFIHVIQDRLRIADENKSRFLEATEAALHFGKGEVFLFSNPKSEIENQKFLAAGHYSRGLHSPKTGRTFRPASPGLFSFNSPLGACPKCRGFGRVIDIDYRLAIPNHSLSINDGVIKPWEGEIYGESKRDLLVFTRKKGIPANVPFAALSPEQKTFIIDGEPGYGKESGKEWPKYWYGLKGFFRYLETKTYKMHVRVFLSRYRTYNRCPVCDGARLQPEALCWKWRGYTLPQLYQLPVSELLALVASHSSLATRHSSHEAHSASIALDSIVTRLRYLDQVGLGYLTLDRTSRTLSGGEVQRVNLTSCLGTSLVDTLFVLDEPSVGLHSRDLDRLIDIIRTLTDAGNTVVVVEHDEAMIRAADHVVEVGPEPGARGGNIVFQGDVAALLTSPRSITGAYFSGRERVELPASRRPVSVEGRLSAIALATAEAPARPFPHLEGQASARPFLRLEGPSPDGPRTVGDRPSTNAATPWLTFTNASKHNIANLSFRLPLRRLVCLSGVSGSGKSTLLDNVIYQGLLTQRSLMTDDPAEIERVHSDFAFSEVVLVDQSPLSRTPRSNPALYCEAWELIRELYAAVPAAQAAGFSASSFSFNSGEGRCDHCQGLGSERVEMQFLSDVFVPCPVCEGRRFKPEVLAITWNGKSVADLLATTIADALQFFSDPVGGVRPPRASAAAPQNRDEWRASSADASRAASTPQRDIRARLAALDEVGLGYLPLGQPLNTLSGGESQRLKLVRYLSSYTTEGGGPPVRHSPGDSGSSSEAILGMSNPGSSHSDSTFDIRHSSFSEAALLLLDEPTTGLHRHDVKRLLAVLQRIVDRGHSIVVIEHNLDVLKSADWILEIGPEAGAQGGRIVAEGTPEAIALADTATSPFLRAALAPIGEPVSRRAANDGASRETRRRFDNEPVFLAVAEDQAPYDPQPSALQPFSPAALSLIGARENNLKNISLTIPHRQLTVVTGVSGSGKSTLAFDIIFAEGQRRFMESMSPYARQFVEQLPRPDIDRLSGIPPTVAIEQRVTRGSRKSTVATITEVAQYLRLLYARLGVQHHPETGRAVTPLSAGQLRTLLGKVLASAPARRAKHLYLCAPLIRGRKGHHEPIAKWIEKQGYELMRADGRVLRVENFQKLDRYKEHDVEVVIADLKAITTSTPSVALAKEGRAPRTSDAALATALRLGKGSCFLVTPTGQVLSWFSTTRTDIASGESFPELDPKHFSFNSPRGWCSTCRGHGRIYDWMLKPDEDEEMSDEVADILRGLDPDESHGKPCPTCHGERLNRIARAVHLPLKGRAHRPGAPRAANEPRSISLPALLRLTADELIATLRSLKLEARGRLITQDIVPQIEERLRFLSHVGLDYLPMDRPTETLSGGEAQRIRLAAQLGSNLSGVLYVLDEPSIGLHARDNDRLIDTLLALREKGNTLLVVEHDDVVMARADRIIDLGPGAGIHGGTVLANDTPANLKNNNSSLTGVYLEKGIKHPLRGEYRPIVAGVADPGQKKPGSATRATATARNWLELTAINYRNLRDQTLRLPLGRLIMVCGPSGAGKSTLFRDILHPAVTCAIKRRKAKLTGKDFVRLSGFLSDGAAAPPPQMDSRGRGRPRSTAEPSASSDAQPSTLSSQLPFAELRGANAFKSVIEVDQSPIGKTPRSTPATYLGIFDLIRQFFASLPESKMRGYTASRFSFNTTGGRCETCSGAGRIKLEMAFMPDSYLPCDDCGGSRYGAELSDITWKDKTIGAVLKLSFDEAAEFFAFHSQLSQICQLMVDCGLGYLTLGQSSPSLSGGEAQRLKLVTELAKGLQSYKERSHNIAVRNLYLLEEPTIGLHLSDCEKLIRVLHNLVDQGNTVVVIEHHLDLLAEADYVIELGPGGGPKGGEILYQGELAGLLKVKRSPTAPYLRAKLKL